MSDSGTEHRATKVSEACFASFELDGFCARNRSPRLCFCEMGRWVRSAEYVRFCWTRVVVALDIPLNDRQLDVLEWVGEGCPARDWPNSTYKTVAVALQNRRLLTISKKGGQWRADLLDAGRHYLAHGAYPPGHMQPKKRSRTTPAPTPGSDSGRSHMPDPRGRRRLVGRNPTRRRRPLRSHPRL